MAEPPAPVLVLSQWPLAPNVASVTSDKNNNEMIPRAVLRSPGIYFKAARRPSMKAVRPVIASNEVGIIAQNVRNGKEWKEEWPGLCPLS